MIAQMIKYNFLVYHKNFDSFLKKLQDLGVVDISKEKRAIDDEENTIVEQISRMNTAVKFLESRKQIAVQNINNTLVTENILNRIEHLQKRREALEISIKKAHKELSEVKPWGNYDTYLVDKLVNSGVNVKFFVTPDKSFNDDWLKEYSIEIIGYDAGQAYVVLIDTDDVQLPPEFQELMRPTFSTKTKEIEINDYQREISETEKEYDLLAQHINTIKESQVELINRLDFKIAASSADKQANETVMILQGWVPEDKNQDLVDFVEKENVIYISEKAKIHDNAPILLKNGRYSKLFEPISKLFALPAYAELDLTPFFAPFFMVFFGFCFGDAGYGLIFLIGGGLWKYKAKPDFKPILSLVQILGAATIVFGSLTGTVFGYDLGSSSITAVQSFKQYFLNQDNMFMLSMLLGLLQIVFGMGVKAANLWLQNGWKHAISTISWIVLIISTGAFYVLSQNPELGIQMFNTSHLIILTVSGVGIMFFNNPGKNMFLNFGLGLWDTYNMATGLLGDTLSYIRLFALGLSGGILGGVFNSLAFGLAPDMPVLKHFVIVLILVIGHSINIFMAALGSLVHPMRLIFVEFYKNAGFSGGGRAYEPFQRKSLTHN